MTERKLLEMLRNNPDLQVEGDYMMPRDTLKGGRLIVPQLDPARRDFFEHELQAAVIAECDRRAHQNPTWGRIFAVPNGGDRNLLVAKKLKAEGVRRGVPDLMLLTPKHGYNGLVIELKVSPNRLTSEQTDWLAWLKEQGYFTYIGVDDPEKVIRLIEWYIEGDE